MTKVFVHDSPAGLVVVRPNPKNRGPEESESDFLTRVWARYVQTSQQISVTGAVVAPHITEDLPFALVDLSDADLVDKSTWSLNGSTLSIDGKMVS